MSRDQIAIVGMAGRFPNGHDTRTLWRALRDGRSLIKTISRDSVRETLHAAHVDDPNYVLRCAVLDRPDLFDAEAFRISNSEALLTDPQQRIFLECCQQVLDEAGVPQPEVAGLRAGVYAGSSVSIYLLNNIMGNRAFASRDIMQILIGCDKDFIATRVAYKLDLRGPSMTVQTGCSTSLVAVHQACQALLNGELDLALAGGATITGLGEVGYLYTPGGIRSPDGLCRPYDAHADGTIFGDGVGVVALCRLEEALQRRLPIHAVIAGSAVNNNGNGAPGFAAPSVDGQADVIREALDVADIRPSDVTFIEGHGTATLLGDPIEVRALTEAFGTAPRQFCALGSVKSNLGHLDVASGVTGLIKAALALRYRLLPATLNFSEPNSQLDLPNSPFFICDKPLNLGGAPVNAGVSSFGFGGTNAHVVLSSPPVPSRRSAAAQAGPKLFVWSARSAEQLARHMDEVAAHLAEEPADEQDVAATLAFGRRPFEYRAVWVGRELPGPSNVADAVYGSSAKDMLPVFLLPGQGSSWVDVAGQLYEESSSFQKHFDRLSELVSSAMKEDMRRWLLPNEADLPEARRKGIQTAYSQPALFILCMSLAAMLREQEIHPGLVMGHSLGELVAACIAGGVSEEDAARLVVERGRLLQATPPGAMLTFAGSFEDFLHLPEELRSRVDIASINGPMQTVLSGSAKDIAAIETASHAAGIRARKLQVSRAFHSRLMDGAMDGWRQCLEVHASLPIDVPLVSNLDGRMLEADTRIPSSHWVSHLREPVSFCAGIDTVIRFAARRNKEPLFLEIGPGAAMGALVRMYAPEAHVVTFSNRDGRLSPDAVLCGIGRIWMQDRNRSLEGIVAPGAIVDLPAMRLAGTSFWVTPDEVVESGYDHVRTAAPPSARFTPDKAETDIATALADAWRKVTLCETIHPSSDFFTLGGDSIQALEVSREMASKGITLKPTDILRTPVFSELVALLSPPAVKGNSSTVSAVETRRPCMVNDDELAAIRKQLKLA